MAYVPPHKRRSKEGEGQGSNSQSGPKPELLTSAQQQQEDMGYIFEDIFRWFSVGLDDRNHFPPSLHLQPVSVENIDWKIVKRLALINTELSDFDESSSRVTESFKRRPWEYIAENVLQDLLSSFEDLRSDIMESQNHIEISPILMARFGKVLFCGRPSVNNQLESETTNLASEDTLRTLRSSFYTNIPNSYVEYIIKEGASKCGLEFEDEKEVYYLFFSNTSQSDERISCKCRVLKEHGKLQIYKLKKKIKTKSGPQYGRYMLRDISCLEKNMDLRLDLFTKRSLIVQHTDDDLQDDDDDMKNIRDLINSAIVDAQVKGGLRWPLGKAVPGDKFCVTAVWHTVCKTYKNSLLSLYIKDVDRCQYGFWSSTGHATREVVIALKGLASELLKQQVDMNLINEMLKDDLKVVWNNFLCCERFPT